MAVMVMVMMMMMMAGASDTAMANSKNVMAQHAVNLRFYSLNLGTEVRKRRDCRSAESSKSTPDHLKTE